MQVRDADQVEVGVGTDNYTASRCCVMKTHAIMHFSTDVLVAITCAFVASIVVQLHGALQGKT